MKLLYGYECRDCGVKWEEWFERGEAPSELKRIYHIAYRGEKPGEMCLGTFARDYSTISVKNDDPFRKAWLSDSMTHELARQRRPLDPLAPHDKFMAKAIHEETGRIYIGDDISSLKPKVQRAILNGEKRKGVRA